MPDNMRKPSFSPAEKTGIIALVSAFLLFFIDPFLAPIPLFLFLLLCIGAPFFPRFGFFLPVISRGKSGTNSIALTFDDGPSPLSTPILLSLLARHKLPATFFVVGEKAAKYPELIANIIAEGHTVGNHSWNHDYFLMLRSQRSLQKNIHDTQEILKKSGIQPLVFRPPVGITGSRLKQALAQEGLITVNYSCRAFDRGNRNIHNLAKKILETLQPGDIIMLHDVPSCQELQSDQSDYWQKELDYLFSSLAKNYDTVPLAHIIQRPVNIALK
jgi:peptidoglycan/xylan/chitin deacetylase (PgdA/CDA1 family)